MVEPKVPVLSCQTHCHVAEVTVLNGSQARQQGRVVAKKAANETCVLRRGVAANEAAGRWGESEGVWVRVTNVRLSFQMPR